MLAGELAYLNVGRVVYVHAERPRYDGASRVPVRRRDAEEDTVGVDAADVLARVPGQRAGVRRLAHALERARDRGLVPRYALVDRIFAIEVDGVALGIGDAVAYRNLVAAYFRRREDLDPRRFVIIDLEGRRLEGGPDVVVRGRRPHYYLAAVEAFDILPRTPQGRARIAARRDVYDPRLERRFAPGGAAVGRILEVEVDRVVLGVGDVVFYRYVAPLFLVYIG